MHPLTRIHKRGRPPHPDILTPAEWEVVGYLRRGMNNAEIARERGTTLDAVKFHIANTRLKLGLDSRNDLAAWARRQKMKVKDPMTVLYVSDLGRAIGFYRDALGLEVVVDDQPNFTQLACGDLRIGLHPWRGFQGVYTRTGQTAGETLATSWDNRWMPNTTLQFGVADVTETCRTIQAAGGRVVRGPEHKPWGALLAEVADPDGNPFEISGPPRS